MSPAPTAEETRAYAISTMQPANAAKWESVRIAGDALTIPPKRHRRPASIKDGVMTHAQRMRKCRAGKRAAKLREIAILDFETDPFDPDKREAIFPFVCELYSDQFGSIVIWGEQFERFIEKVITAIESLPGEYTIYAHNGGKFDFLFLVSK